MYEHADGSYILLDPQYSHMRRPPAPVARLRLRGGLRAAVGGRYAGARRDATTTTTASLLLSSSSFLSPSPSFLPSSFLSLRLYGHLDARTVRGASPHTHLRRGEASPFRRSSLRLTGSASCPPQRTLYYSAAARVGRERQTTGQRAQSSSSSSLSFLDFSWDVQASFGAFGGWGPLGA